MKFLVTGATGLLGNNVVRQLLERGDDVRVLMRASAASQRALEGLDCDTRVGDICELPAVRAACRDRDVVIHAAARVHIGWRDLELQRQVNVEGTRHIATAALETGAKLVHISSVDTLSPMVNGQPVDESTPLGPKVNCSYVVTKRAAEACVREMRRDGLRGVIIHPGFMLGPWDWKPSSGRMLLRVARRTIPLAPAGGMSICDVRDVAAAVIEAGARETPGEQYILAGENRTYVDAWRVFTRATGGRGPWGSIGPIVRHAICAATDLYGAITGGEGEVNSAALKMSNMFHYYCSQRAARDLNYSLRPLEITVRDAWQWFRQYKYA